MNDLIEQPENEIVVRIRQRLAFLGLSERAASLKAGLSASAIRNARSGLSKSFRMESLRKLAEVLETTPEWLAFGSNELGTFGGQPDRPSPTRELAPRPASEAASSARPARSFVPVRAGGVVQAGHFRAVSDYVDDVPPDMWEPGDVEFPNVPLLYFDVAGDSMNNLKPRPILSGDRVIGVEFAALGHRVPLRNEMVLVIEQSLGGGTYRERSVKQLEIYEDRYEFCPRSTNPKHQPIVVPHDLRPDDGREVQILALVRRISNELPLP